ncbi:MAG TPA: thiamine pyrophosphate-dependent enzyme [Candidatus Udaeobacter sp.]|nr:thiamine pyrophosphate-dependent enzyme [Candidatus Udaeobacter sp.]
MVDRKIPVSGISAGVPEESDSRTLTAALEETLTLIRAAKKPVILAGVELARYRTARLVIRMAERMNIPIAADLLSKSAVPENHRLYIGVYGGAMSSDEHVRKYVESADLVLMLGTFITDMSMGFYTAKLDRRRTVLATTERVSVQYHRYESIQFPDFLKSLATAKIKPKRFHHPNPHAVPLPLKKAECFDSLTMVEVFRILSLHLDERCCVVADVGDAIFGAVGIRSARQAQFIAPAYYMSMGFAVPGSIGVAMAAAKLRPYVLVGDGAFQMTGVEISTIVRLDLNPIIIILNNDGYGTMRSIRAGCFNQITQWDYRKVCELVRGGQSTTASTKGEFDAALRRARKSNGVSVIELKIPPNDTSRQLARIASEVAKMRGSKKNNYKQ